MKHINILYVCILSAAMSFSLAGCSDNSVEPEKPGNPSDENTENPELTADPVTVPPMSPESDAYIPFISEPGSFAKGADVSWITEMEANGEKFYNVAGQETELMKLLRDECGITAIRLRVWVDPTDGWNNVDDVLVKARRARELGLRLMIDFHFSDWWADPGKQVIPAAWSGMTLDQVKVAMAEHVTQMLTLLKDYDIEPEWVQVGNETPAGMMLPLGSTSNGTNFAQLVTAGYDAVKAIFPNAQVIVHCDEGNRSSKYTYLFGKLREGNARYDMIGMSLYPESGSWQQTVNDCLSTVEMCQKTFGKPVIICEIGYDVNKPLEAQQMLQTILDGALQRDVKGIFWWEPESTMANSGYGKGAFQNGRPTGALDPFK